MKALIKFTFQSGDIRISPVPEFEQVERIYIPIW